MGRAAISILFFWLLTAPVIGQQTKAGQSPFKYIFRNIDNTNGLISNEVTSLVQDDKGYMWIGTEKGLQRYDGLRFVNCIDTDSSVIDNMPTYSLYPDDARHRILYNQACNHLNEWDKLHNKARSILPAKEMRPEACVSYQAPDGRQWLLEEYYSKKTIGSRGTREGLVLVRAPAPAKNDKGAPEYYFASFVRDGLRKETWVRDCYYGLMLFNENDRSVSTPAANKSHNPLLEAIKGNPIGTRKLCSDSRGNIWLLTWEQTFYRYNIPTGNLFTYSISDILTQEANLKTSPAWVSAMLEDNHGVVWLATSKAGLLQYDFEKDSFLYTLRHPGNGLALQYNHQTNDLFQDRQENIWVATDRGISIFNPYRQYFTTTATPGEGPAPGAETEINTAGLTQGGQLLAGNWGSGITVYDSLMNRGKHIYFPGQYDKNLIWSIFQQSDGKIWAGCQRGLIHIIDTLTWSVQTISPPETEHSTVRCLVKDRQGNTLIGLHNGKIITWDPVSGKFLPYLGSSRVGQKPGPPLNPVVNIFIDRQGLCWAGTWQGVSQFDPLSRKFILDTRPPGLNPAHTLGITDYDDSTLVVGMENGGLYFYNKRSARWFKVPVNVEQPLWSANAIRVDKDGNIWFTTDYEICSYNPVTKKFFTCHPEKGLLNSSFNSPTFLVNAKGKWLSWSYSELIGFEPAALRDLQTRTAHATITGFRVFSVPRSVDSLIEKNHPVRLNYTDNFIGIEFSDLQFSAIAQTKFYYRLTGIDKDWVYGGTRGSASYTNIPPGTYTFEVKTGNTQTDNPASSLVIIISAPFWATGWFLSLVLLIVAAIVYLLVRWRIRHIQKEGNMKQQMAQTEMMALRAQMNPHFIFNCINSIDALIQCNDKYHATVYLNKFARLIRNILDSSRSNTIPLTRDLETLQLYIDLEQFRSDYAFEAGIHTDPVLLQEDYKVPPLIIQPYVENAILHGLRNRKGTEGRLMIDISRHEDHLLYTIEDNGVGRYAARSDPEHRSHGMEMSQDRVRLFNKEDGMPAPVVITDLYENGQAAGTRVEVRLKIQ